MYEVRVFSRKHQNVSLYDVSIISTRGTKGSKKTQFSCTFKFHNSEFIVVRTKKKACYHPNKIWNDNNFVELSRAILAWFMDNVITRKAFSMKDDTAFWHFKQTEKFGDRYTLYDCGIEFLSWNLNYWLEICKLKV